MGGDPFPLSLVHTRQVPRNSPLGCCPLPLRPHERMMEKWFGQHRRMCCLLPSFRIVNSPISRTERYGSQNGRGSEVPDVYENCPLKPCKGGIRQRISNRPPVLPLGESEINALPHPPDPKIFGEYNSAKPSWANLPKANVAENLRMSLCDFAELARVPILSKKGSLAGSRGSAPCVSSRVPPCLPRQKNP